jgi:hypothetical protein
MEGVRVMISARQQILSIKVMQVMTVCLSILALSGCVLVNPITLDFGSTETTKTFTLTLIGDFDWSITHSEDWIKVEPGSGQGTTSITVTVDRTGLENGYYEARLNISANPNLPCPDVIVKMIVEEGAKTTTSTTTIEKTSTSTIVGDLDMHIYDEELLYDNSEIPFDMDASFATLKKSSTEFYFWHTWGQTTYKYYGPLDDPLKTQIWIKTNKELFDYRGKANPNYDYIWINNIYERDNGDLLAFCHIEKNVETDVAIQYAIGLVYSTNNGDYWTYCGEIIRPQEDTDNIGGVPYLVVGDYFYVYFNEKPLNSGRRICVARANVNDVLNAAQYGEVIAWNKYDSGTWSQDGLTGAGSNIILDINGYDVHSDAAYNRTLKRYMLTLQNSGQLFLYISTDGINWGNNIIFDETDENDFIQCYSFFAGFVDASDDCREVGSEFYIIYPRKDWPNHYDYDELYRRLVTIGYETNPPPPRPLDRYIFSFSGGFSAIQGQNNWYYQYKTNNTYADMTWQSSDNQWKVLPERVWVTPRCSSP